MANGTDRKRKDFPRLAAAGMKALRENGARYVFWRILFARKLSRMYSVWMQNHTLTKKEACMQRNSVFQKKIRFSIAVPLYNTPIPFLCDMLNSVLAQTYDCWQLCIADGSDVSHGNVGETVRKYADHDDRILYRRLDRNLGIAENTNACLKLAAGDYVALLDHDDILHPSALYEMMRVICDQDIEPDVIYTDEAVFESPDIRRIIHIHFKPDYAPDNLRANNYLCHFTAFRRSLLDLTGAFRSGYDGSQDHDLMLRLAAVTDRFIHIPRVLYYWRAHPGSSANDVHSKHYAYEAGKKAIFDSLKAQGMRGSVNRLAYEGLYRVSYDIDGDPKVSIVIVNRKSRELPEKCLRSITEKTSWKNREIIVVDPQDDPGPGEAQGETCPCEATVFRFPGPYNWAVCSNRAIHDAASGDYILLLDPETVIITPDWIEQMLMFAQRKDVGAVGAMLYDPGDRVLHAGVILGVNGIAGYPFHLWERGSYGYCGRLNYAQDLSAVSGTCMMIRRDVWNQVGGLDDRVGPVCADLDLCLRIRKAGGLIVWTPFAELYYSGPGLNEYGSVAGRRGGQNVSFFLERWGSSLASGDPYYNPNLTLRFTDFTPAFKWLERN